MDMNALMASMNANQAVPLAEIFPVAQAPSQDEVLAGLSDEQAEVIHKVLAGQNVIVDATVGSGKTSTIQALCQVLSATARRPKVLYLTYSRLLKKDAQLRVGSAKVQNYHGIVYPYLLRAGIRCGISTSIREFNKNFDRIRDGFERVDVLIIDEYQDITEDYAQLLENIRSTNPDMQIVMVGDLEQKVNATTTLDVQAFAARFCTNAVMLPFTQSFRIGPELASMLSKAWNKPITGANLDQQVQMMDVADAIKLIADTAPGDLLCLGTRKGLMSQVLNHIESNHADRFNKSTVYASIRDADTPVEYGPDTAVFTTFDSAKGLERPVVFVFDYSPQNWEYRLTRPGVDPEVLRNVFLVAASRGKGRVVFVTTEQMRQDNRDTEDRPGIGLIPVESFTDLPGVEPMTFPDPVSISRAFDFTYIEHIQDAYELLEITELDAPGEPIQIQRTDALIDLAPVVGNYQEAVFFTGFNTKVAFNNIKSSQISMRLREHDFGQDRWRDCLVLAAVESDHLRYMDQVHRSLPVEQTQALVNRLSTHLDPDDPVQLSARITGVAKNSATGETTSIDLIGLADAFSRQDGQLYELKFASELDMPMFLQLACYLVAQDERTGVLWNTHTNQRFSVTVPEVGPFCDAVIRCVSKGDYDSFIAA